MSIVRDGQVGLRGTKSSKKTMLEVWITSELLGEARRITTARLRRSDARLIEEGLILIIIKCKRELFAKAMRRMARDPQARAENRKISKEFKVCDNDGLEGR